MLPQQGLAAAGGTGRLAGEIVGTGRMIPATDRRMAGVGPSAAGDDSRSGVSYAGLKDRQRPGRIARQAVSEPLHGRRAAWGPDPCHGRGSPRRPARPVNLLAPVKEGPWPKRPRHPASHRHPPHAPTLWHCNAV